MTAHVLGLPGARMPAVAPSRSRSDPVLARRPLTLVGWVCFLRPASLSPGSPAQQPPVRPAGQASFGVKGRRG